MRVRNVLIHNFRGIKEAKLDFPKEQRLICLIGPGDSTKSTILTAIHYALWPTWNLTITSDDFYECNTSEPITIEVSFDEFPDSFYKETKYGLYLRGSCNDVNDEPTSEDAFLTVRLQINDSYEPEWNIVCSRLENKKFSTKDRQLISPGMIGIDFSQNLNWGQGSALTKHIDPRASIKKNVSIIEQEARKYGDYTELDAIAPIIKSVADGFGVNIEGEINNRVSFKSRNVTSTIELFEDKKPLNQRGYGSKKLINLGLLTKNENEASVLLIDEIEIGLEPYRQRNLIHKLKKASEKGGQVMFTTHSPVVLVELSINQMVIVRSKLGKTYFKSITCGDKVLDSKMQGLLRKIPDTFLTPRILVCEGITEIGFVRALDEWLLASNEYYMASKCVSYADGKGGGNSLEVAKRLSDLGYEVALLLDNDRTEDEKKKQDLINKGIPIFCWELGKCIETALLPLLTIEDLNVLLNWESEKKESLWKNLCELGFVSEGNILRDNLDEEEKEVLFTICAKKEFFKRIAGGEELGKAVFQKWDNILDSSSAKKVIDNMVRWISNE